MELFIIEYCGGINAFPVCLNCYYLSNIYPTLDLKQMASARLRVHQVQVTVPVSPS